MPILTLIVILVAIGFIMWLVNTYIPMQPNIKKILNVFVVILVIIWLLKVFGILGTLSSATI